MINTPVFCWGSEDSSSLLLTFSLASPFSLTIESASAGPSGMIFSVSLADVLFEDDSD